MFMAERTVAIFPPDTASTNFEVHQDLSYYYLDSVNNQVKSTTFFVESYVSTSTWRDMGDRLVSESTRIENGPPGMRTRFTLEKQSEDRFIETFELAMPGEEFEIAERLVLVRVQ
jgi:hypothetical protein